MATLDVLKRMLRQKAINAAPPLASSTQKLSDSQYASGFGILKQNQEWTTYQDFVIPQLSLILAPLFDSHPGTSILEVGPGPKSVLGYLPRYLRQKVKRYAAYEPNDLFASELEEWLCSTSEIESPLPCLERSSDIKRTPFAPNSKTKTGGSVGAEDPAEGFDVVLFCHSLYGMRPKHEFIECALNMLTESPEGGLVVLFHRGEVLDCEGLACYRSATCPTGVVRVTDNDDVLDRFSRFVAGFVMQDLDSDKAVRFEWRKACRSLGCREEAHPGQLLFDSPNLMVAFNRQATSLPELISKVPLVLKDKNVKSWQARSHRPTSIVRPTDTRQVQQCIRWAIDHELSLTILGGGHSGHCLWPNVVSVDMGAFDQVHIFPATSSGETYLSNPLVVAGAGCKSGDIIRKTMEAGLIVPLGARPSVGAGLWLQGGIGHLARLHGLTCDSVVGAVLVSVASSEVFCIGLVPSQHQPTGAMRPQNESDLMWALKGAGTNFGILVSITFKASAAPKYLVRNSISPLNDKSEALRKINEFDESIAKKLTPSCSVDAYIFWDENKLHLGGDHVRVVHEWLRLGRTGPLDHSNAHKYECKPESENYNIGNCGQSRFKRCVFLKHIGTADVAKILVAAMESRPSPLCYLHLLQGGGAVGDVAAGDTAFGCRDWDFACVVTGVWARDHDGTKASREVVKWVYKVATDLLPSSSGVYGSDLGPDPRDALLAARAFGPNQSRLVHLKHIMDPKNVLAYACPLIEPPVRAKLVILVTGDSCAGKDHCADVWRSLFTANIQRGLATQNVSISDPIKQDYAAATGSDLHRLLHDRAFKEQHRPALSAYFHRKLQQRPRLLEEQFLQVMKKCKNVDVLLITGMREEAPVAAYSHLVQGGRLLEVRVEASKETRQDRRGCQSDDCRDGKYNEDGKRNNDRPCLMFNNDMPGDDAVERFGESRLLPFLHEDLQRLANMVRVVPDFPRPGNQFHHVLGISQEPGGLVLCTSLLQTHFSGDWAKVKTVACCETGGWIYASALSARVGIPLSLIREGGKLPPPTFSVVKSPSHISSSTANGSREKRIEIGRDLIPRGASVCVVDDVLATGNTLCAVLQLLIEAGVGPEDVVVMVVAEFPLHRGRQLLRQRGFGGVKVQSILVFDGL
ncbi:hypothetical protein Q7P37_007631 [Cladosporium fusiforme]